jgi:Tfp pilus assembly major pilin PilA
MLKKSKMSVQQRKYFVERITSTINNQILAMRQANAAEVYDVSEKHYKKYLKSLKLDKVIKDHKMHKEALEALYQKIEAVYSEVKNTIVDPNADWRERQDVPNIWNSSSSEDINKAFRWACNETARQNNNGCTMTKDIKALEKKRDKAIDILHGVEEFSDVMNKVNASLKGTEVPKLGA